MANTYTLIASNTLSSSAASVTFSSIPNTYTDLVLKWSTRLTNSNTTIMNIRVNGNSGSIYSGTYLQGYAGTAGSNRTSGTELYFSDAQTNTAYTTNTFSNGELYLPSYTSSNNKPMGSFYVTEDNSGNVRAAETSYAHLIQTTSAITSILLYPYSASFATDSSFFLYGISKN